ncbi:hypothetical protein ACHHYP_02833 [Achlya hypogyna]|uniref:Uncharacterized protein n=1 Tax=Achlya hypogyna TaxID=1202772 RepID=A0A1V9ZRV8_ACHHY|nr:hypothetical protein ACHHYP_02833 [Achlya hypogyna]
MLKFTDSIRQIFKDTERRPTKEVVKESMKDDPSLTAARRAKRRSFYADALAATYPNVPVRDSDDKERAKQKQILDFLLSSYDAENDESHGHVLQALDLCSRLSATVGPTRVAKTQCEMSFVANVVALGYLSDGSIRRHILERLEAAKAKHEWFVLPRRSSNGEYPKWVHMAHPPSAASFESYLYEWSMIATLPPYEHKGPALSRDYEALLDKLVEDGEFYMLFLTTLLTQCRRRVSKDDDWKTVVPQYDRLVYIGLRLVYECAYETWAMAGPADRKYFVCTARGVKTVMLHAPQLMLNSKLAYVVIQALLEVTNVHNERSVGHCLHQLEEWLLRLDEAGIDLMATVRDYDREFSWIFAMKLLLLSDHMDILKKTLLFLYTILPVLPETLRVLIMRVLLHRHFDIFLHWNHDVRRFYHHILVYRLVPGLHRAFLLSMTDSLLAKIDGEHELSFFDYDALSPHLESLIDQERAKWAFFDVLVLSLCLRERQRAHEANKEQRLACDLAEARVKALKKDLRACQQSRASASFARECMSANALTDVDEKLQLEVDEWTKLKASLPYLRVTPQDQEFEVAVASANYLKYFTAREGHEWKDIASYTRTSLLEYTAVLQGYYAQCPRHPMTGRFDVDLLPAAPELTF